MSLDSLTPRHQSVFGFIVDYKCRHDGNSPSIREIMEVCDISSTSMVSYALRRLERVGVIKLEGDARTSRRIEVVGGHWTFTKPEAQDGDNA